MHGHMTYTTYLGHMTIGHRRKNPSGFGLTESSEGPRSLLLPSRSCRAPTTSTRGNPRPSSCPRPRSAAAYEIFSGLNVMNTIFGDFYPFSAKKIGDVLPMKRNPYFFVKIFEKTITLNPLYDLFM
jgi:hypothetical protein